MQILEHTQFGRIYVQCRACILKPPHQGLLGSSPTRRNSPPLGLGTSAERSQTCGITISESSQLSSLSQFGRSHPISPLRSQIALAQSRDYADILRNSEIAQTFCAVSRLAAQSRDWHAISGFLTLACNFRILEIAQIPRLR